MKDRIPVDDHVQDFLLFCRYAVQEAFALTATPLINFIFISLLVLLSTVLRKTQFRPIAGKDPLVSS